MRNPEQLTLNLGMLPQEPQEPQKPAKRKVSGRASRPAAQDDSCQLPLELAPTPAPTPDIEHSEQKADLRLAA